MAGGYYHTGDVASRDSDGYITYVGRTDDVFKSSDYKVSPFELESVLIEHPAVVEAAVVPQPDDTRLAVPKAYIAIADGWEANAETARQIMEYARDHLAPYLRVRRVEFYELPKTISGKIRRVDLRRREDAAHADGTPIPTEYPLRGSVEVMKSRVGIWASSCARMPSPSISQYTSRTTGFPKGATLSYQTHIEVTSSSVRNPASSMTVTGQDSQRRHAQGRRPVVRPGSEGRWFVVFGEPGLVLALFFGDQFAALAAFGVDPWRPAHPGADPAPRRRWREYARRQTPSPRWRRD